MRGGALRFLACALALWALPSLAGFSFHYNENGGFGFYQPEGWRVFVNGRSSRLSGPAKEESQSEIFAGSDWVGSVHSLADLKVYVEKEAEGIRLSELRVGELNGFSAATGANEGRWFLFRSDQNVIVLNFALRGSPAQVEEGRTILSSFEIRTGGISYP
jgi:hypothetical protein